MRVDDIRHTTERKMYEMTIEQPNLDPRAAAMGIGVALLSSLAGAAGWALLGTALPWYGPWQPGNVAGVAASVPLILAWFFGILLIWYQVRAWRDDLQHQRERRAAHLDRYEQDGTIETQEMSHTSITVDDPSMLLLLLLSLWQRRDARPWSVRELCKPHFLRVDHRIFGTHQIRIGEVPNKDAAQAIQQRLSGRLLAGGGERSTYRLIPDTLEEFLSMAGVLR
jgi:hypothetical protein